MKKNILAIQMCSAIGNRDANFAKVKCFLDKYCKLFTPNIVVLPEVWTTGWYCPVFSDLAEADGKTEDFLSEVAKKYNASLIGGSYIRAAADGSIKNTCPVFNRGGELLARYDKIHLYAQDGEALHVQPGQAPVIVEIEGIKTGLSICYDIRFPELYRSCINTKNPPELFVNVSAWPLSRKKQYSAMAVSRAIENQAYFLALSQTGLINDKIYNSGNSLFADPMGNIIQKLGQNEGALCIQIDTEEVQRARNEFPNLANRKIFDFGFKPEFAGAVLHV